MRVETSVRMDPVRGLQGWYKGAMGRSAPWIAALSIAVALVACSQAPGGPQAVHSFTPKPADPNGIGKIKHVIVIMQENRSFDHYFGTFPGADGFPVSNGAFTVCNPDPVSKTCIAPYHDAADVNGGADHTASAAKRAIDGGKMDGFVAVARRSARRCAVAQDPACANNERPDVMGYHDAREIPNYWAYAKTFVLQDHMFEPVASWSLPQHLYMVSGWSARCLTRNPTSCKNNIVGPVTPAIQQALVRRATTVGRAPVPSAWTDITYLLYKSNVSWSYFIENGSEPDCENDTVACPPTAQSYLTPGIWNPLPAFVDVQDDRQLGNIKPVRDFWREARDGTLPAVSWICASQINSEHPAASIAEGQSWVTKLVNDVMQGPDWSSSAIFLSWDDWGGFYDHLAPPRVDQNGYGLRVPGLVISAYAKKGFIDHAVYSHDAYLKFIEDDFLAGARLDPATDGRPDPRPDVREEFPQLSDLAADFDFSQAPRPPLVLPLKPAPGPASQPG